MPLHRLNKHCGWQVSMFIAAPTPAGDVACVYEREHLVEEVMEDAVVVTLSSVRTQMEVCCDTHMRYGQDVVMLPGLRMLGGDYDHEDSSGTHMYGSARAILGPTGSRKLAFSTMTTRASMTFHATVALHRPR